MQPPTPRILEICDLLEEFIRGMNHVNRRDDFGCHEAPVEAGLLLKQATHHVAAMITLARTDLGLLPSVYALARVVFEICLRVRWLLYPEEVFEREARWLAHLAGEEDFWKRLSETAQKTGDSVNEYVDTRKQIYDFRASVQAKFPASIRIPKQVPNLREMLKEQGDERRYIAYSVLSQFTHGNHFSGTDLYRSGLGTSKEISAKDPLQKWLLCLQISWWSLYHATDRFVEIACEPGTSIATEEQIQTLNGLLR